MAPVLYQNFAEASQKLLEILNAILPDKTLMLAKKTQKHIKLEKVLHNDNGILANEGDLIPVEDVY
ncbi:hypothetical protein WQ57_14300 [Mesobacillus campisalis]|uniref:Uncharacterized protein n=1 Tax=Mesobacillus campisalis TaxID=1408103 RepID=A0A0M2SXN4_9BACI|nr:hypothetical protein [Mesobacillus campisalis]KKK37370.1 hypothetical protein WQ57_14300 [Mesobacillus campisalis]